MKKTNLFGNFFFVIVVIVLLVRSANAEEICNKNLSAIILMKKDGVSEGGVVLFKGLDADGDGVEDNLSLSCSGSASYYPPDPCELRWVTINGDASVYSSASVYVIENERRIYFVIRDYPLRENGKDPGTSLYSMVNGRLEKKCLLEKGRGK